MLVAVLPKIGNNAVATKVVQLLNDFASTDLVYLCASMEGFRTKGTRSQTSGLERGGQQADQYVWRFGRV